MAQLVERRLGKAEVGGSNPLGSSMKTLEFSRVCCYLQESENRPEIGFQGLKEKQKSHPLKSRMALLIRRPEA